MFTGRPTPPPGEPLFTKDDTAAAVALAEEERDTCPSCGMLKVWCRDPANQTAFDPHEEMCFPTWRMSLRREAWQNEGKHKATQDATQLSVSFRDGHEPDLEAGLDLEPVEAD